MKSAVAGVHKMLLSVSSICDHGNIVQFDRRGGFVMNLQTGAKSRFGRVGGTYHMDFAVQEPPPGSRTPQGAAKPQGALDEAWEQFIVENEGKFSEAMLQTKRQDIEKTMSGGDWRVPR